jgi:hypothetical protein
MSFFDNSGVKCSGVGDTVTFDGQTFTCTADDLVTPAKRAAISGTLANVRSYLQKLLRVTPIEDSIAYGPGWFPLYFDSEHPFASLLTDGHTDLHITVYPRTFGAGSTTLASAAAVRSRFTIEVPAPIPLPDIHLDITSDLRPVQGVMNINMRKVTTGAKDPTQKVIVNFLRPSFTRRCTFWRFRPASSTSGLILVRAIRTAPFHHIRSRTGHRIPPKPCTSSTLRSCMN